MSREYNVQFFHGCRSGGVVVQRGPLMSKWVWLAICHKLTRIKRVVHIVRWQGIMSRRSPAGQGGDEKKGGEGSATGHDKVQKKARRLSPPGYRYISAHHAPAVITAAPFLPSQSGNRPDRIACPNLERFPGSLSIRPRRPPGWERAWVCRFHPPPTPSNSFPNRRRTGSQQQT